jgi:hypothetical protein
MFWLIIIGIAVYSLSTLGGMNTVNKTDVPDLTVPDSGLLGSGSAYVPPSPPVEKEPDVYQGTSSVYSEQANNNGSLSTFNNESGLTNVKPNWIHEEKQLIY